MTAWQKKPNFVFEYATELFKELYAEKKETDQQVGSDQN